MRRTMVASIALLIAVFFVCSMAEDARTCRLKKRCRPRTCCPATCTPAKDGEVQGTNGHGKVPGTIGPRAAGEEDDVGEEKDKVIDVEVPTSTSPGGDEDVSLPGEAAPFPEAPLAPSP